MKKYLFIIVLFLLSCKKELEQNQVETTKVDTLSVEEVESEIDTIFEYEEHVLKMIIKKGEETILNKRSYLLSEETVYDSVGDKKQYYRYTNPGSYGMQWLTYYKDGSIKEKGQLVEVFGGFLKGGEHLYYAKDGYLEKKVVYTYKSKDDSYHQTLVKAKLIEFYADKKIKSERFYEGGYDFSVTLEESQDNDSEGYYKEHAVGTWKFYSEEGKLIKIEKF